MDVDDRGRLGEELLGEDLHVAGEHDEIDVMPPQQLEDLQLLLAFPVALDREGEEGNAESGRHALEQVAVGDDDRDLAR